jgi:membrane protease YdiL (CAAX protease family)
VSWTWIDHGVFAVLAFWFPLRSALLSFRRLQRSPETDVPRVRLAIYRQAILFQWAVATFVVVHWWVERRPATVLGLVPVWSAPFQVGLLALVVVVPVVLAHTRRVSNDEASLAKVRRQVAHVGRILPKSPAELRWFYAVAVTAGICEEVLYRGFLVAYLGGIAGPWPAVGLAALVFGFGHVYQGWRGMLATTLVGLLLGGLFLLTGSLLVPMVLHGLIDVHSGTIAYWAHAREPEFAAA